MNTLLKASASVSLLFLLLVSAFGQVPVAAPKIVLINTDAFYDEKTGITKLIAANKKLDLEFAARLKALQDGNTRLQAIAKELDVQRGLPAAQFNQTAFNTKTEEGEALQRKLNFDKTDLESDVNRRRQVLVGPVSEDIGKGITEFSKRNGYGAVFDISKLAESGVLLFLADAANVTKEFIAFYNARPSTVATTSLPK